MIDFPAAVLMVSTMFGLGSACPISDNLALTAAHVVDERPFDRGFPLQGGFWSNPADPWTENGTFEALSLVAGRDLALIGGEFHAWFKIADRAPRPNEELVIQGYDWRGHNKSLAPRTWKAKVQYRAGRMASLSQDTQHGSSGGCVLNSDNEVEGILVWGMPNDNDSDKSGVMVLVYSEKFEKPVKPNAEQLLNQLLGGGTISVGDVPVPGPEPEPEEPPQGRKR